jgi:hypothetical protein
MAGLTRGDGAGIDEGGLGESLPPAVHRLLRDVVADGFVRYCCGPRTAPVALLACYDWPGFVDLLTIRTFDRITAARAPKPDGRPVDVFDPQQVVWAYQGPAEPALRALLDLVHPAHPDAPTAAFPAPAALHIPRHQQRPLTVQLPHPDQRTARATRLATATHAVQDSCGRSR